MANVRIQLDFSVPSVAFRGLLVLALMLVGADELVCESVTLTTYYPAPSGVYIQMITTNSTWLARDAGQVNIRTNQLPGLGSIVNISGNASVGAAYVASNAPANGMIIQGNVGIGTNSPGSALNVAGQIVAGGVAAAPGTEPFSAVGAGSGISLADRTGGQPRWIVYPTGGALNTWNATYGNTVQFGKRGYVYINNANTGCVFAARTPNALSGCGGYITWEPGVYVEGWTHRDRGGNVIANNGVRNTTQVWGLDTVTGVSSWHTLNKNDSAIGYYCCPK